MSIRGWWRFAWVLGLALLAACGSDSPSETPSGGAGSAAGSGAKPAPRAGRGGSGGLAAGAGGAAGGSAAGAGAAGGSPAAGSGGGASGSPAIGPGTVVSEPMDEAAYLFDQTQLREYNIVIAPADLAAIDAQPSAEAWVPASLEFEGKTYGPYMVRYKGGAGAFMYPCTMSPGGPKSGKCSLKLGFNEVDATATFYGLRKLNFHSLQADVSMLRERLGYSLFREMNVASPRAVHVKLKINGQLEGLFAAVEQIDGRFTRARFSEGGEGNLYKEIWPLYDDPALYTAALETNEDEMPSVQRMLAFKNAISESASAAAKWLDRDYLLRYIAVDRVITNDDGIFRFWCDHTAMGNNVGSAGNHNYYWYEALESDRFWLVPWDLDKSFEAAAEVHLDPNWTVAGQCACNSHPEFGIQRPASCDPLIQHFATWQPEFNAQVDAFLAGPFAQDKIDAKLVAWSDQIRALVTESDGLNRAPSEMEWADAVIDLRMKIDSARRNRGYAY